MQTMYTILIRGKLYIVVLLSLLVVTVWTLVIGSMPVSGNASPVRLVIAKGASANRIAAILDANGLVRSPFVFVLTCRLSGTSEALKPGVYELNRAMSAPRIIEKLVAGESLETWVTFPEGFNARQIGDLLQSKLLANGDAFVQLVFSDANAFPMYSFVVSDNLEGYLFPDTYLIARGTDPRAIVGKMLDAFETKVAVPLGPEIKRAVRSRLGRGHDLTFADCLHTVLIVASLIEREAKADKDRALISAVLWNRLGVGMRLQVDATVSYVPGVSGSNRDGLSYQDLRSDSPYNTYKHGGLPPAPICNPGLESIKAAIRPANVDYLYYVVGPDGKSHVFSKTYEEHLAAKKLRDRPTTTGGR